MLILFIKKHVMYNTVYQQDALCSVLVLQLCKKCLNQDTLLSPSALNSVDFRNRQLYFPS